MFRIIAIWLLLFSTLAWAANYPVYNHKQYKSFYADLGKIEYYPEGKSISELEILIKQMESQPQKPANLKKLGVCYHARAVSSFGKLADANQAEKYFDMAVALLNNSSDTKLINNIRGWKGGVLALKPKFKLNLLDTIRFSNEGASLLDRAIYNNPEDLELRFLRANTYIYFPKFMGKNKVVVEDSLFLLNYFQAYFQEPSDIILKIYGLLAVAYQNNGEKENSKLYLQKILALAPNSELAKQVKEICGN